MDYRNMSFGDADPNAQGGGETIPDGTLAWAIVTVRPSSERFCLTPSKSSDSKYLDVELTILEGPYARRKVWDKIGLEGKEGYVQRGMSSIRHILEVGRRMTTFESNNNGYRLGGAGNQGDFVFMELNELQCAIKIGFEEGTGGYKDKNVVRAYLSPNPTSDTNKAFQKLVSGETQAAPKTEKPAAAGSWGGGGGSATTQQQRPASPQQTQQPQGGGGRPSWAGNAPAARATHPVDDDIPY